MHGGEAEVEIRNLALGGGVWSTPPSGRFTPGKDPIPIVQEIGRVSGPVCKARNISHPPVFDPRVVQPVARRYTDCAIRPSVYL